IEAKNEDPVNPLVGYSDEAAAWIKHGVVGMRACLLFTIRARFAGQVHQIAAWSQASVLLDGHHADIASAVISGDDPAAGRIERAGGTTDRRTGFLPPQDCRLSAVMRPFCLSITYALTSSRSACTE